MDVGSIARPAEPEESPCEADTPNNDRGQPPFRDRYPIICFQLFHIRPLGGYDIPTCGQHTHDHSKIRQTTDARVHTMLLLEYNGISCEEEIQQAIDECLGRRSLSASIPIPDCCVKVSVAKDPRSIVKVHKTERPAAKGKTGAMYREGAKTIVSLPCKY